MMLLANQNFIDSALKAADLLKSPITGLIHHCYEEKASERETIPLYENFCYVLALFRSHQIENFKKGKELLTRLLHFSTENGFPRYLHDYPTVYNAAWGVHLVPIFYWIRKEFGAMLGSPLQTEFEKAFTSLLAYLESRSFDLPARLKIKLDGFYARKEAFSFIPESSEQWGSYLIALQMANDQDSSFAPYFDRCKAVWLADLGRYIGPSSLEKQEQFAPKRNFFHLAMSRLLSTPLALTKELAPLFLHYALFREVDNWIPTLKERTNPWICPQEPKLFWNNYSLVCEDFKGSCAIFPKENGVDYLFTLEERELSFDQDAEELNFYLELPAVTNLLANSVKATVFSLGDKIVITSSNTTLELTFSLSSGSGTFMGHIAKANRPSQTYKCPKDPYTVYDWKLFLRTIRRSSACTVALALRYC